MTIALLLEIFRTGAFEMIAAGAFAVFIAWAFVLSFAIQRARTSTKWRPSKKLQSTGRR